MNTQPVPLTAPPAASCFELRFESLYRAGYALAFPCNALGCVELDSLSDPVRHNCFYARAVVGREFAKPAVVPELRGH